MSTRLIKRKIVNLTIGSKKYKYIEILREIISDEPTATIDLTSSESDDDIPQSSMETPYSPRSDEREPLQVYDYERESPISSPKSSEAAQDVRN